MDKMQITAQQYLSDIENFKGKFFSELENNIFPKYSTIDCPYLNVIIRYIVNLAELSNQFAILQKHAKFISSIIISRSIFEECAILNSLIKESKYGERSFFYKSLIIKDMYQDIVINNSIWENSNQNYWRRIHSFLSRFFPNDLERNQIQPFINDADSSKKYDTDEQMKLKNIVEELNKNEKYTKYKKSKICAQLFNDVYLKTNLKKMEDQNDAARREKAQNEKSQNEEEPQRAEDDINGIYNLLCHYSHLNITAIDNFKEGEDGKLYFEQKIDNNDVVLQWMKFSLDYILNIFTKYCDDLYTSNKSK